MLRKKSSEKSSRLARALEVFLSKVCTILFQSLPKMAFLTEDVLQYMPKAGRGRKVLIWYLNSAYQNCISHNFAVRRQETTFFLLACKIRLNLSTNPLLNSEYTVNAHDATFRLSKISAHDVTQAMHQMETTKSVGTDNISYCFLKLAIPYF